MTEAELQAIEERWAKVTMEPWRISGDNVVAPHLKNECIVCTYLPWDDTYTRDEDKQTITAIAHAPTDISALLAEVRRLNRMVDSAVDYLEHSCCDAPQSFDCEEINRDCADCWKEYLESEVGNNG